MSKFLDAVLAKLSPEDQAALKAKPEFAAMQATAAEEEGRLAQEETRLTTWRGDLDAWRIAKEAELAAKQTAIDTPAPKPGETVVPPKDTPAYVDRATFDKEMESLQANGLSLMAFLPTLVAKHYDTFKEVLDVTTLMTDPRVAKIGVKAVYDEKFKPQYDAKALAETTARETALREEGRQAALKELGTQHPYPIAKPGASALDAIGQTPEPGAYSVDAAVAEYNRLVADKVH